MRSKPCGGGNKNRLINLLIKHGSLNTSAVLPCLQKNLPEKALGWPLGKSYLWTFPHFPARGWFPPPGVQRSGGHRHIREHWGLHKSGIFSQSVASYISHRPPSQLGFQALRPELIHNSGSDWRLSDLLQWAPRCSCSTFFARIPTDRKCTFTSRKATAHAHSRQSSSHNFNTDDKKKW